MPSMICAPDAFAAEAGADVLANGGNAVDAAVTAAFAQGVLDPHDTSVGGYVLINIHQGSDPTPTSLVMDAPVLAGSKTSPDMWVDQYIGPNPDGWGFFLTSRANELGYQSICTPGTVRGLATILERWGTMTLEEAVEPAARLAEGFVVDSRVASYWHGPAGYPEMTSLIDTVRANREASKIYLKPDGSPLNGGDTIRNPDYARTLRHIGRAGADDFYTGELGRTIANDLAANDSWVTAEDLANYRVRDIEPSVGTYRGYTIASSAAPHGGPTLIELLNILEGWDLTRLGHNSADYILRVAAAMKASFADRNEYLGDPEFVDTRHEYTTSKARATEWRTHIEAGEPIRVPLDAVHAPGTTQVTVVDKRGTCVSLTHSLGASSGVITPGLGFMYNNSMINYQVLPGHPNSIAPGKSRTTGMAPTIVYRDGKPVLVVGAPGGTKIITSIAQVIVNVLDFGMGIQEAVSAPRFHCQGDTISAQRRIPRMVIDEVAREHPIVRMPMGHGGTALVHAIGIDQRTGRLSGGADTGADGMAIEVA